MLALWDNCHRVHKWCSVTFSCHTWVLGQLNYLPFFYLAESVKAPVNTADWHYAHQPLSDKRSASLTARSFAWTARGRWSDKGKRTWYLLPFNNCTLSGIPDRSGMSNETVAVCVLSEQCWLIFPGPFGWPELQPAVRGWRPLATIQPLKVTAPSPVDWRTNWTFRSSDCF